MHQITRRMITIGVGRLLIALLGLAVLVALLVGGTRDVGAQIDRVSCGFFETQADAQAYFEERTLEDPSVLDWDGDGIACEDAFVTAGPTVIDRVSCGHFESRAAAQEYFDDATIDDPSVLDPDGDGVACEFAFDDENTAADVVALPSTGAGAAERAPLHAPYIVALVSAAAALLAVRQRLAL